MLKKLLLITLLLCVSVLAMTACMPVAREASFPATNWTPIPQATQAQTASREVQIESIEVQVLKSDPVQINAVVTGDLTEACAKLGDSQVRYASNTFQITLLAVSPTDRGCAQVTTPFESTFPLNAIDLPAGTYTVTVNGVSKSLH
jgi:hypothetical protein